MPCLICGNPKTVTSHLTPRAFVLDVRGDDKHAYQGNLITRGTKYTQAGIFDKDILCDTHESMLKRCDDYAIDWVRSIPVDLINSASGKITEKQNPHPDLMLKFVCSHVWRHAVSSKNRDFDMDLGHWEGLLRQLIFCNSCNYNPTFHIFRQRWTSEGEELKELLILPHRLPYQGRRRWTFYLGGLLWTLRLNERYIDQHIEPLKANDSDPIKILTLDDREFTRQPGVLDILVNMASAHN